MPIVMTTQIKDLLDKALSDGTPCLLGTADKSGRPQISPKGSVAVFDPETLSFWERSRRSAFEHLKVNPHVVVYYRNTKRASEMPFHGAALRFHGIARVFETGPEWHRAWSITGQAEQEKDPERRGVAVLIRIDRIEELSGKVVMRREEPKS